MSLLEEDKIAIWSKNVIDLNPQPDTILLIISKFEALKKEKDISIDISILDDNDENLKLKEIVTEFAVLGICSIDLIIKRLQSLYNYKSRLNENFQGLYESEFKKIIHNE